MSEELLFPNDDISGIIDAPPAETPTVLLVGDAQEENARARRVLERYCFRVISAPNSQEALDVLGKAAVVAIIADERFEQISGLDFLRRAMAIDPKPRRILIGAPDASLLAASINQGWLFACLPRPFDSRSLSQTAVRASEAYAQKEEQRRLIEELTARVQVLEAEVRSLTQKNFRRSPDESPLPVLASEYRLSANEAFESARAIPVKLFGDQPPKPFQSAMPIDPTGLTTERELVAIDPEAFEQQPIPVSRFQENLQLSVMRLSSGLSAGAPPEETAWGLAALTVLNQEGPATPAMRRAASRLMGLAGSGRGGSIAAWALSERYARTQNPADRDMAEAALAWVSLPATTTPDLAAVGSLLALVAGAEAGLTEDIGAAERLRNLVSRLAPIPNMISNNSMLAACIQSLAGKDTSPTAATLAVLQRTSGGLAGEVDLPDSPPLISTAMAAIIFGASQLQGTVVRVLRQARD